MMLQRSNNQAALGTSQTGSGALEQSKVCPEAIRVLPSKTVKSLLCFGENILFYLKNQPMHFLVCRHIQNTKSKNLSKAALSFRSKNLACKILCNFEMIRDLW